MEEKCKDEFVGPSVIPSLELASHYHRSGATSRLVW